MPLRATGDFLRLPLLAKRREAHYHTQREEGNEGCVHKHELQ